MNYEQFKDYILEQLKRIYPEDDYDITIRRMIKNNGKCLDGLCIFKNGTNTSPTIYLDNFYNRYKNGMIMADILASINHEYSDGMKKAPVFEHIDSGYEMVRDQIIMRLINYDKNKEIMEECPHIRFFDLAISFRWLAHHDEIGISTSLITHSDMERWGINVEQLYEDAARNTPVLFPPKIMKLRELVDSEDSFLECDNIELYVMTNEPCINGATCILYDYLLDEFGAKINSDFYILPSSIHEMMLCPVHDTISINMLLSLVNEANRMVVSMGEVLSDNIYYYNIHEKRLSLIQQL